MSIGSIISFSKEDCVVSELEKVLEVLVIVGITCDPFRTLQQRQRSMNYITE